MLVTAFKTHSRRVKIAILILLVSSLAVAVQLPSIRATPTWLFENAYVTYEQAFAWSGHTEVTNMTWRIIKIEGDQVNISLTSYNINESFNIIPAFNNFTINSGTREITSSTLEPQSAYVGHRWFFWIETNVSVGTTVDTYYFNTTIGQSEKIDVLGKQRDTWFLEHYWTSTVWMKRWYDKATGIVLKIQTGLDRSGTQIEITETAKSTNINLPSLQPSESGYTVPLWVWLVAILSMIAIASVVVAATLKWKAKQSKQKNKLNKAMLAVQLEDTSGL